MAKTTASAAEVKVIALNASTYLRHVKVLKDLDERIAGLSVKRKESRNDARNDEIELWSFDLTRKLLRMETPLAQKRMSALCDYLIQEGFLTDESRLVYAQGSLDLVQPAA